MSHKLLDHAKNLCNSVSVSMKLHFSQKSNEQHLIAKTLLHTHASHAIAFEMAGILIVEIIPGGNGSPECAVLRYWKQIRNCQAFPESELLELANLNDLNTSEKFH